MQFKIALRFILLSCLTSALALSAEPIVGTWQLDHQDLNGQKKETEGLTLQVTPKGDRYLFAFSVPVNNIDYVSMTYLAKLDGSDADVKDARGNKVGTVQITEPDRAHYRLVLKGENRPETVAILTVSSDSKTLTSVSESKQNGNAAHLIQQFVRSM